jgi:DNA recombination protein RmuC
MTTLFIGIIGILLIAILYLIVYSRKDLNELKFSQQNNQAFSLMQQQLESLREQLNRQLGDIRNNVTSQIQNVSGQISQRLDSTGKVIGDVREGLGKLGENAERILEVGKDISSLQEILQAPKLRGGFGEYFLEDLIKQILPPENFKIQYRFKSGEMVDAVVKLADGLVPVDAKFPLENFKKIVADESDTNKKQSLKKSFARDVKKHIDKIAEKYILTDEGTYDFALMYIPAENVYYETIIKDENLGEEKSIIQHAMDKRVIPVSPNTFYAYLQAIVRGLRGMQIEKSAKEVIDMISRLQGDFNKFSNNFETIGTHLNNAKNKYDEASKRLGKFEDKLKNIESTKSPSLVEISGRKEDSVESG